LDCFVIFAPLKAKIKKKDMPVYDYGCAACGSSKEVQHSISEIGKITVACDDCGTKMVKQLSTPALIGFDNVGRSVTKKPESTSPSESSKPASCEGCACNAA
jgi:putative FmdB family regulatory protein